MRDKNKTKEQLINDLVELRERFIKLEKHSKGTDKQFKTFKKSSADVEKELKSTSMELAIGLSEVFEALKRISAGDPKVRIPEKSKVELVSQLKHMVNMTAKDIGEMIDQCHEFAICLCEQFDVFKRVSRGDLDARVSGVSKVELLEVLKGVTNETIETISKAREDMERLRRHHELILNSVGEGILGLDTEGNHTFVNPAAAKILGAEVEELIGKHSHTIWHHTKADGSPYPEEECPIYSAYKDGAVHYMTEEVFWRKDGTNFPVQCTSTPIVEAGNIIGAVVNFRDITDRRRADEQIQSQLRHLEALRDIDRAITSSLDLRITLNVVLDEVTRQLRVSAADVLLFKPHLKILEYAAGLGFRTAALQHTGLKLGHGHAGFAALERRIIEIPELSKAEGGFAHAPLLKNEGFVTYFAVPLISKGQIKGILEIFHRSLLKADREWMGFLESLAIQAAIAIDNAELFNDLQRSNIDLALAYDATIEGWSHALEMRDKKTEGHSQRVTEMTLKIAQDMGIGEVELVHVRRGALLHDIGKMGIPDSILNKQGKLTGEEREIMHNHPMLAYEMLSQITFLRPALDIPYCHHEKWDGTGYPRQLKGKQIPLSARIFAVVDVWDALCSERPYRPAWPEEKAREYIKQQAGVDFDPQVVEVFLKTESEWQATG
jgi:PAS domain S-box-containing protein/putative nucleotidyltransferase with HDIG domain